MENKIEEVKEFEYHEEGIVNQTIGAMIALFVGLGVLIIVVIMLGILNAKAFSTVQSDISGIDSDGNVLTNPLGELEIRSDINGAIVNGFSSFADGVAFLGIIVLALVFFLVLALLATGMRPFSGGGAI